LTEQWIEDFNEFNELVPVIISVLLLAVVILSAVFMAIVLSVIPDVSIKE
jgi:hypothetical protein